MYLKTREGINRIWSISLIKCAVRRLFPCVWFSCTCTRVKLNMVDVERLVIPRCLSSEGSSLKDIWTSVSHYLTIRLCFCGRFEEALRPDQTGPRNSTAGERKCQAKFSVFGRMSDSRLMWIRWTNSEVEASGLLSSPAVSPHLHPSH